MLAMGAAILLTAGVAFGAATWYRGKPAEEDTQNGEEEKKEEEPREWTKQLTIVKDDGTEVDVLSNWAGFEDPDSNTNHYLTKIEAKNRSEFVSDVSYLLTLGLAKGGQTFNGKVTIDYTLSKKG